MFLHIFKPSPNPFLLMEDLSSSFPKAEKSFFKSSGFIPTPESFTLVMIVSSLKDTEILIKPSKVNFKEFPTKLKRIYLYLLASE